MSYVVGIDLGTTSTVAAVCRPGGAAQVVPLEGSATAVPSAVYLGADGTLLVGEAAQRRALSDPGHVVRDLTRRVGDATPVLVGRRPVAPDELAARFLARLVDDVARREGGVAARVAVTHPAGWGPHRMGALHAALAEQGLGSAMLVPEPVAAATGYAAGARIEPGATVGIYDLGGGRCDATVLRAGARRVRGRGRPRGRRAVRRCRPRRGGAGARARRARPGLGGARPDRPGRARRRGRPAPAMATAAKEALSHDTEVLVPVALPGSRTQVRLGRAEFEEMIRPALTETVEAMRRALDGAGTSPADLAALVLVGGSSRIPLVPQLLSEEFGRDVTVAPDPVGVVAVGAALVAAGVRRPGGPPPRRPGGSAGAGPVAARQDTAPGRRSGPPPRPGRRRRPGAAGARRRAAGRARRTGHPAARRRGAGSPDGTEVLAVARPPKQARPFVADASRPTTSRPRRIALLASAGALALAVLGGVVAFGIERVGAGTEAGAVTPAARR